LLTFLSRHFTFSHFGTFYFVVLRFVPLSSVTSCTAPYPAIPSGLTTPLLSSHFTIHVSSLFPYIPPTTTALSQRVASALARMNSYAHCECYARHKRIRMYLEKECSDVAVCRVWRYGRSSMVPKSSKTRCSARINFKFLIPNTIHGKY